MRTSARRSACLWALVWASPLLLACNREGPTPTKQNVTEEMSADSPEPPEFGAPGTTPDFPSQTLEIPGFEVDVPAAWRVLPDGDPDFAMAFDPSRYLVSSCVLERRRQGIGPLPEGTRLIDEGPRRRGYMRGSMRGMIEEFADSRSPGGWVALHCRARRSDTKTWSYIEQVFASMRPHERPIEAPSSSPRVTGPVVELCSAAPVMPGHVCARRDDGSVYCGSTQGPLVRRSELAPASDIGCARTVGCARAKDTGEVACWYGNDPAKPVPALAGARELTDACAIDAQGKVACVRAVVPTGTGDARERELVVEPLQPFDNPALGPTDVRALMPGSTSEQGCVARDDGAWCWDDRRELPVHFRVAPISSDEASGRIRHAPERVIEMAEIAALEWMGQRLCARTDQGPWHCRDFVGQVFEAPSCATDPCGCSSIGATRFSCEDQPETRIDALPQARVIDVVARAEPCVLSADGRVLCRVAGSIETAPVELVEAAPAVDATAPESAEGQPGGALAPSNERR